MLDSFKRAIELLIMHYVGPEIEDDPWWLTKVRWWTYPEYSFPKRLRRHTQENPIPLPPIASRRFYRAGRPGWRGGAVWMCETVYVSPLYYYGATFKLPATPTKGGRTRALVDAYNKGFGNEPGTCNLVV